MDDLLFLAGRHLLAALAPRTEIFLAIGDCRRTFADYLSLDVGDDCFDLALLQTRGRVRRLLVADIGFGHAEALLALCPGKLVEMRHGSAARHAATDDLDQLVVVELAFAQISGFARRLRVAGTIAGPAVAEAASRLILVEPLTQADIAGGRGLRCHRGGERQCRGERHDSRGESNHVFLGPAKLLFDQRFIYCEVDYRRLPIIVLDQHYIRQGMAVLHLGPYAHGQVAGVVVLGFFDGLPDLTRRAE